MIKENNTINCPHCNNDLPEEIDFCPYCMERLTPTQSISPPPKKSKGKRFILAVIPLLILAICSAIVGVSLKNDSDKSAKASETESIYTDNTTFQKADTTVSDTQNKESTTISNIKESYIETSATKTESNNSASQINAEIEIVNRWNNANNNLYIYNFMLNNYTFKQEKEQICISQRFNNSGAKIDFKVKDNFEEYTLRIDNITNLNIMYQLCRISLSTIALNQYSDTEFYDFISDNSWETVYENEETKSGVFSGYNCNVVLTEVNEPGAGGLDYTYYTCVLSVKKVA